MFNIRRYTDCSSDGGQEYSREGIGTLMTLNNAKSHMVAFFLYRGNTDVDTNIKNTPELTSGLISSSSLDSATAENFRSQIYYHMSLG